MTKLRFLQPLLGNTATFLSIAAYFAFVFRFAWNLPVMDDYETLLAFALGLHDVSVNTLIAELLHKHNDSIFLLLRGLALLQVLITSHLDFKDLILIGNSALVAVFWFYYRAISRPVPAWGSVALTTVLLFSPTKYTTATWATSSVSRFLVIVCALGAFHLFASNRQRHQIAAFVCAILGVLANASGMLIAMLLVLAAWYRFARDPARQRLLLAIFSTLVALAVGALYGHQDPVPVPPGVFDRLFNIATNLDYLLIVTGSAIGFHNPGIAAWAGAATILLLGYLTMFQHEHLPLPWALFLLFLFASAIAITSARPGLADPAAPRYQIISQLIFATTIYWGTKAHGNLRAWQLLFSVVSIGLAVSLYAATMPRVQNWSESNADGLAAFLQSGDSRFITFEDKRRAGAMLEEAIRRGIFVPPPVLQHTPNRPIWSGNTLVGVVSMRPRTTNNPFLFGSSGRLRVRQSGTMVDINACLIGDASNRFRIYVGSPRVPAGFEYKRSSPAKTKLCSGVDGTPLSEFQITLDYRHDPNLTDILQNLCLAYETDARPLELVQGSSPACDGLLAATRGQ